MQALAGLLGLVPVTRKARRDAMCLVWEWVFGEGAGGKHVDHMPVKTMYANRLASACGIHHTYGR